MQVTNGIPATQLPMARWRKSQASNPSGCCVEVAELPGGVIAVRNSRDPAGPALVYTRAEVAAFLTGVKNGEFDDLHPGGNVVLLAEATTVDSGLQRPGQRGYQPRHPPAGDTAAPVLSPASRPYGGCLILPYANAFLVDTMGVPGGEAMGADAPGPGAGMSVVPPGDGPPAGRDDESPGATALRIMVGSQLRRLRESAGVTPDRAGYEIRASRSKISRMEHGRVGFKDRDVADLLALYGVTDEQVRTRMQSLAQQANSMGWWSKYDDVLPDWFEGYVGLEGAASVIRSFELQFVHGLFQTEGYARAVTLLGHNSAPAEEIDRRVSLRLKRQDVLANPGPPQVWSVMDEAVLRRPLGGRAVMRAQLEHLAEIASLPHVTIQVVPFGGGGHAAAGGSFSILRFAEPDLPDIVYIEQLTSALYLGDRADVDHYLEVMNELSGEALTPARSARFLADITCEA